MAHEIAINSLHKKRTELISKRDKFLSEINQEISDLEDSIASLSGKVFWASSPESFYDDDSPNSLSPSYEE